ncbi:uncharacterized protein LOC118201846 [Stegodyphus dumicola]|uniref:uncharacterized protein LOC118201846 n=1 Tax=Stegodyphus dumicola TaxID=202533 RepID=UPI0015A92A5F|nr:uncharacterized protein LOC118201846 [Stegodyphus dumicola]
MTTRKSKVLNCIQRPFVLGITRAYRKISTAAASVLAGLILLPIKAMQEAAIDSVFLLKMCKTFGGITYDVSEYEFKSSQLDTHPSLYMKGVFTYHDPALAPNTDDLRVIIFTDGSKLDGKVGCAFVAYNKGDVPATCKGHMNPGNTVFQAEVLALHKAIGWLTKTSQRYATIFTDSLSAMHAFKNPRHSAHLVTEAQKTLRANTSTSKIRISWVKAHSGTQGNEKAGELAKEAAQNQGAEKVSILLPKSHLKGKAWEACGRRNEVQSNKGGRTQDFIHRMTTDWVISAPCLTRFIMGHGPFPSYFKDRVISTTNSCVCGNEG